MPPSVLGCLAQSIAHHHTFAMTEAAVYHMLQDLRLLARRDSTDRAPRIDQDLEQFRLSFFAAFEQWMDGMKEMDLTPFIADGERILTSNKDLLRWLKRELDRQYDR